MAVYKVPQDIEAEDKLIGPFSFKQFLFLIGTAITGFMTFSLGQANVFLAAPLVPVVLTLALFGLYRPKDQPAEVKVLAYINFLFKPRKRIWSRDGIAEHVVIKAPKRVRQNFGDDRTKDQVRSQLKSLATIVDTRGWSSKRAELQDYSMGPGVSGVQPVVEDDRIISTEQLAQNRNDPVDVHDTDDEYSSASPTFTKFDQLTQASYQKTRQQVLDKIHAPMEHPPVLSHEKSTSQNKHHSGKNDIHYQPFPQSMKQKVVPTEDSAMDSENKQLQTISREEAERLAQNDVATISQLSNVAAHEMKIEHDS